MRFRISFSNANFMKLNHKLNPVRLIRRNKIPVGELEPVNCDNCGIEFKGHFCPNCGQEVAEFNRPLGFVLYDFAGNFFAFDTRFFKTFWYLLSKPGFLTNEFFAGRRVRYSPPFRIFVFLSFLLFLFVQLYSERGLDKLPETKTTESGKVVSLAPGLSVKSNSGNPIDSLKEEDKKTIKNVVNLAFGKDSLGNENNLNIDLGIFKSGNIRDNLNRLADSYEAQLKQTTDPAQRRKLSRYIAMCRAPEMVISRFLKYLSWAFFLLLPVFALILKLFYIRRNQYYIRHLIFSVHLHSYLFFILMIIVGLKLLFAVSFSWINAILIFSFPVYVILSLRKFYGQSFGKVILKFLGISLIYNAILWSSVMFVFLRTLDIV